MKQLKEVAESDEEDDNTQSKPNLHPNRKTMA